MFTGVKALWLALSVLGFLCVQRPLFSETWRVDDQVYEQVRVHEVTPADVTIFHAGGIKKFSLGELPKALQERFWYDPEEAAGWEAFEARQRAEAREAMEAEAAERKAAALARKQPERQRPRSAVFRMAPPENVAFYPEVDLRPFYIEKGLYSKNQGRRPSCSVFAVVSALEYEQARRTGQAEPLSEDFLIWATLQLQPGIPLDTGFNFPEVITALQTYGVPSHAVMPNTYGKSASEIQPPPAAMEAARDRTSVIPVWFRHDDPYLVERLVAVLNQGKPVIIAVRWPHWRTLHGNYLLRNQKPLEGAAHAVTLVGYRNTGGASGETKFIFRNSYGYDWGLAGCGFISDSYLREHLLGACFLRMPVD